MDFIDSEGVEGALMRFYLKHSWARAPKENIQSKVQKTAHELEATDLGREMKTSFNILTIRTRLSLLKGTEGQ